MEETTGALGIIVENDVPIPMRDGVILRANVFRPDAPGRYPGLLLRTPYGKPTGGYDPFVRAGYSEAPAGSPQTRPGTPPPTPTPTTPTTPCPRSGRAPSSPCPRTVGSSNTGRTSSTTAPRPWRGYSI